MEKLHLIKKPQYELKHINFSSKLFKSIMQKEFVVIK